ncbi:MAG: CehA/McbA family metallohydrolase [Myxococcales bacterium]|nr:CehA/McbA family metallohydrolase [Myxococcales bacterium]
MVWNRFLGKQHTRWMQTLGILLLVGTCRCGDDGNNTQSKDTTLAATDVMDTSSWSPEVQTDNLSASDVAADVSQDDGGIPVADSASVSDTHVAGGCPGRPRVPVDLAPWETNDSGMVRLTTVDTLEDRISGEVPEGRIGDYVLENSQVRFLIGLGDEAISPCSYDGNLVDMTRIDLPEAHKQGDILGEICFLLNGGLTFAPECAEVLSSGADKMAALAVTGRLEILDFLNLKQMVGDYAPFVDLEQIAIDLDHIPPLSLTIYYLLRPNDTGLTVLTALRNDGSSPEYFAASHLIMSGSTGAFFNPLGGTGGFGTTSLSLDNLLAGAPVPYVGYLSDNASYLYVPKPLPNPTNSGLPFGGSQIAVGGIVVNTFDIDNFLSLLSSKETARKGEAPGFRLLQPGEVTIYEHSVFAGDGRLESVLAPAYDHLGVPTVMLQGIVSGPAEGVPAQDVTITAVATHLTPPLTLNQTKSSPSGSFEMRVPPGSYLLKARAAGSVVETSVTVAAGDDPVVVPPLIFPHPAQLRVVLRDADGVPTIGRVTITCPDGCPQSPTNHETDVSNLPPTNWARIVAVGPVGETTVELPPGAYRVMVSRGMTHSVWPPTALTPDDPSFWGMPVLLAAGETVSVEAEIHPVLDLSGVLSGDFHIHAMASSDSEVSNTKRVMDFLTEGVDVMVSTDHDAVSDFGPTIAALGLGKHITSLIGAEITTPNIGHFNAFPLSRDPLARKGGPIDWSNGADPNLTPAQLYQSIADHSGDQVGEQVVQINHATGSGTIGALKADVLTGYSFADRDSLRMPPAEGYPDPITGDTGLWSDNFTAMEVLNGHSMNNFWGITRWWLTLVSRGAPRTGTAVTDTHGLYGDLGGSPRSWVFVGEDQDTVATMKPSGFVEAVNAGRVVGSNGPFFRVTVRNDQGEDGGLGDTVRLINGGAWAEVEIQTAEWVRVDTIDVYLNEIDDLLDNPGEPGVARTTPLEPSFQVEIPWEETDRQVVATGNHEHRVWRKTVKIPLEIPRSTPTDAWVVFMVRGKGANIPSMAPVLRNGGVKPLAFSNPVFLDADGGGYDNPPLGAKAAAARNLPIQQRGIPPKVAATPKRPMTVQDLDAILQGAAGCEKENHGKTEPRNGPHPHGHSHRHPHSGFHSHH